MARRPFALPITKPVSAWTKQGRLKGLFKRLSKVLVRVGTTAASGAAAGALAGPAGATVGAAVGAAGGALLGAAPEIAADLQEASASSAPTESSPGELAWTLIQRAFVAAAERIVLRTALSLSRMPADPDKLSASLEGLIDKLDQTSVTLDATFFARPLELPLLADLGELLRVLLMDHGIGEAAAKTAKEWLPRHFLVALDEEWRRYPDAYAKLKDATKTPFTEAGEREFAWQRCALRLHEGINEPVFGETFGLVHVYVWPRAYWLEEVKEAEEPGPRAREVRGYPGAREARSRRVVILLEEELDAWIERGDRADAIRVISGGPGAGKSSFTKMFAARRAARGDRVLLIPLHELQNPMGDLEHLMGDFIRRFDILPDNPLDRRVGERRLLLIFDGLDELSMQGKAAAEIAKSFVREVRAFASARNQDELRIQALLDGRDVVVQACEEELRTKPRQVLHLLPYYVPKEERERWAKQEGCHDPRDLLAVDQRDAWWRGYHAVTGRGKGGLPEDLRRPELDEITAQPLLNYLVAIGRASGKIHFTQHEDVNRNRIYKDLLTAVYERKYSSGRQHPEALALDLEGFVQVLEEVGLAAWHGDGRTATVPEIEKRCRASGLEPLLEKLRAGAKSGATRLLAAFYFRRRGDRGGEDKFEFTHKSFGEYLTAKRLVRALAEMEDERDRRVKTHRSGWDDRKALAHWAELCGPAAMDENILQFLCDEIALVGGEIAARWQVMVCALLDVVMVSGMPMEELRPRLASFQEDMRQARNAEEALLAAHWACARVTRKVGEVAWPNLESVGEWLARLSQHGGHLSVLARQCLGRLDLRHQMLFWRDFGNANLMGAYLVGAYLVGANLGGANLGGADLGGAYLEDAHLAGANLVGANLVGAELVGADLANANLEGEDLEGANLQRANLVGANLLRTYLQHANLYRANLEGALLEDANLEGANLQRANLQRANLQRANLRGADLRGAALRGINYTGADVRDTILDPRRKRSKT